MSDIRMHVLEVRCRHCGEAIAIEALDIEQGDTATFHAKIAEIEAKAESVHTCREGKRAS